MIFGELGLARFAAIEKAVSIGREKRVLFVDCGNGFDPYQVLKIAGNRVEAKLVLERVFVSRPFTFYQLNRLVYFDLEKACRENNAFDIIFFGLNALFCDESRDEEEKLGVLSAMAKKLVAIKKEAKLNFHFFLSNDAYSKRFEVFFGGKNCSIVSPSH